MQIADLHCDLLCYLAGGEDRTPYDARVKCSIPQLQKGGVRWQVMPVFTETGPDSAHSGLKQAQIFPALQSKLPNITSMLAIENASSFCNETEKLEEGLNRLATIHDLYGKVFYISLTWNTENRFGGGALTSIGLKREGEILLEYIQGKQIALDFSHASDRLAYEALSYIDNNRLEIPVIASHSNARKMAEVPRNLPDELIVEIIKRKGVIGLNFVRSFVGGEERSGFIKQLNHFLTLGSENSLCFGADFFYEGDLSLPYRKPAEEYFFAEFSNASTYSKVLDLWSNAGIHSKIIEKIAHKNFASFLGR